MDPIEQEDEARESLPAVLRVVKTTALGLGTRVVDYGYIEWGSEQWHRDEQIMEILHREGCTSVSMEMEPGSTVYGDVTVHIRYQRTGRLV